jgi:hypothetical protein
VRLLRSFSPTVLKPPVPRTSKRGRMSPARIVLIGLVAAAAGTAATVTLPAFAAGQSFVVTSVSNPHPDLVSGGEVLIRVSPAEHVDPGHVTIERNGVDVTDAFVLQPDGTFLGLVDGLLDGQNAIVARGNAKGTGVPVGLSGRLTVVNHPITGPVFSGPQQVPFFCETQAFGLPAATQPLCSAPTAVSYRYRSTDGTVKPLADPSVTPADVALATVGGRSVPYVVRLEQGTIDRAVYQIAALYDGAAPQPLRPDTAWNRRLVYTFGGGCNGGFHQGSGTGGVLTDLFLSQGYAVASSTLNVLDTNCNTVLSAEAAMMVKEHFVETYGPVAHTIGWGGSGGAIQQYDIADNYPGILDGIIPGVSFPDPFSTLGPVTDCRLLDHYIDTNAGALTPAQQRVVSGFGTYSTCRSWDATFANRITATDSCNPAVPVSVRWNPTTNPDGVKCSAAEQVVTLLGRDPATGFARSAVDNVGVQYGLAALKAGQITPDQFIDLNTKIGGYDYTGKIVGTRSQADPQALTAAYADGLVLDGGLGLATTPVIDQRTYVDFAGPGTDIHTAQWSYVIRQRMIERGTVANQVIIETPPLPAQIAAANVYQLAAMDRWLTAIDADGGDQPLPEKVAAAKPTDLTDGCTLTDGQTVHETLAYPATGTCGQAYPIFADTRLVAGAPLAENVLKCQLKPVDFADYPVVFTDGQQERLRAAFADGVCDYTRTGVAEQSPAGVWQTYGG